MVMFQCYVRLPEGKIHVFQQSATENCFAHLGDLRSWEDQKIARNRCGARHV